ncbi:hypothetical protein PMIN06_001146 [Paraphaeosphaeria minitans]|uniref:Uncharacterized protein n=1 Tax=Paraphaeosphaeria minitans TaxID=565426 RepID=A0A9P6GNR8_9PLEO|nr:hypothetical protein PMIN01_05228 [Paraphaeosphaeria minitans]
MTDPTPLPALLALAEAARNTGTEIHSIGGKLHMLAAALETEAANLATERGSLSSQLAAAQAAERNARTAPAPAPWGVDVCVGIRANPSSSCRSNTVVRKIGCCTGCGAASTVSAEGGAMTPAAEARSQLSKALSEVADRAEKAASQVRSAEGGAGSVVSRMGGSAVGVGAASRAGSSHASLK